MKSIYFILDSWFHLFYWISLQLEFHDNNNKNSLKMRHRDPRLFYLSMEVTVRRAGVKTLLVLDDDTRPAILQACHPKGESRFCLQLKPGGLIRVHTSALQSNSQYKSLVISEETTSDELLQLLLSSYNSMEPVEQFSIYEVYTPFFVSLSLPLSLDFFYRGWIR